MTRVGSQCHRRKIARACIYIYIYIFIFIYLFIYLFISPLPRKNMHFSVSVVFCLVTTISITRASVKGENRLTNWRIINPCIQDHENSLGHLSAFLGWKDLERCLNYGGQLQVATAAAQKTDHCYSSVLLCLLEVSMRHRSVIQIRALFWHS